MRIFVCWDTLATYPLIGEHPCGVAYHAVVDAGHEPEVVRAYGWEKLPDVFNRTSGRREVQRLTGSKLVPVLVLDDGEVVAGSQEIVAWAEANPAPAAA